MNSNYVFQCPTDLLRKFLNCTRSFEPATNAICFQDGYLLATDGSHAIRARVDTAMPGLKFWIVPGKTFRFALSASNTKYLAIRSDTMKLEIHSSNDLDCPDIVVRQKDLDGTELLTEPRHWDVHQQVVQLFTDDTVCVLESDKLFSLRLDTIKFLTKSFHDGEAFEFRQLKVRWQLEKYCRQVEQPVRIDVLPDRNIQIIAMPCAVVTEG